MDTRRIISKQFVVHFPWTGVKEEDDVTAQNATQVIEGLHTGATIAVPNGGGWKIDHLWSVKKLAWMCFAGLVVHGLLIGASLAYCFSHPTP